jgi:isoamylase/glycogen operon protein
MHVDGFRFDLASVLTRDTQGHPMEYPTLIEAIVNDPILRKVKLIAEPWDAVGLYQVGSFPKWGPWSEWNGAYRDIVRRFIKGTSKAGPFANALMGSEMTYHTSNTPLSSINFITAHDGFTLRDLVSYQNKHNTDNGEDNQDGNNQNDSWNCGCEGPTEDPSIQAFREQQMRNFLLALFLSQGVPMFLMGDSYGHTRDGNNNPYVQDNELNWFLWDKQEENEKIFTFISSLSKMRRSDPRLRHCHFLKEEELDWHSEIPFQVNWDSHIVGFTLKKGKPLYAIFNAHSYAIQITLPPGTWRQVVYTAEDWIFHEPSGPLLPSSLSLPAYSALLATAVL